MRVPSGRDGPRYRVAQWLTAAHYRSRAGIARRDAVLVGITVMDDLRELQSAVRRYFELEHEANEYTHREMSRMNAKAESLEMQLHKARAKILRLAGIDETD